MPNPISLAAWIALAAFFAWDGRRRGPAIAQRLRDLGARPAAIRLSLLLRVAVVPLAVLVQWVTPFPLSLVPLWVVCDLYLLAISPTLLLRATGGRDERTAPPEPNPRPTLRSIWEGFEELARLAPGLEEDACQARFTQLISDLLPFREGETAPVATALAAQAPVWVFPPDKWSIDIVRREIDLHQLALALWSENPPARQEIVLPVQTLWTVFKAYEAFVDTWRPRYRPAELSRREEALHALVDLKSSETERLIDALVFKFRSETGLEHPPPDAVQSLMRDIQQELDRLFPSVQAFRGATEG